MRLLDPAFAPTSILEQTVSNLIDAGLAKRLIYAEAQQPATLDAIKEHHSLTQLGKTRTGGAHAQLWSV